MKPVARIIIDTANSDEKAVQLSTTMLEFIRERADKNAGDDDELDFYTAALDVGCTHPEAQRAQEILTVRVMRARGGL